MIALLKHLFGEQLPMKNHSFINPIACPKCSGTMPLTLVTPLLFGSEHENATFTCANCGHETTRTIPRNKD